MKTKILSIFAAVAMMFVASSCEPNEERVPLSNSYIPGTELDLSFTQTGNQGNGITLNMNTPGVYGYWDYNIDKKFTDEVSFIYPIPGEAEFTFHILNNYSEDEGTTVENGFSQSIKVNIQEFDQPLPEQYYMVAGADLQGKSWKFAGKAGEELWWFMSANDSPGTYMGAWWDAGLGGNCPADEAEGTIKFDLAGGAHLTHTTAAGVETVGSFAFNGDFSALTVPGPATILAPLANGVTAPHTSYVVCELTEDRLALYTPQCNGTGWTWVFVPAE